LQFVVNNETTIVDKYSDAMTDNMVANQGLAGDFIDYERSIAA